MITELLTVKTRSHEAFYDITGLITSFLSTNGISDGLCNVFIPHTTCGITINENADPSVREDILMELDKIVPLRDGYRHMEGNSAAHLKSSMMGFSVTLPIIGGFPALGTWQGIYLCEFDGPRSRTVRISIQE